MMFDTTLLLVAAFVAGALNAVAGGGSFLTLPALVLTGIPPVVANATGTLALLPGYLSGAWGFRQDTQAPPGLSMRALMALLLLVTPDVTFRRAVPWLLLLATALFAFGPQITQSLKGRAGKPLARGLSVLAVTTYGGYFNGGLGILLLALFGLLGQSDLHAMNGLKNRVSALLTVIAAGLYSWGGLVVWREASIMMGAALLGGFIGARGARRLPTIWLRRGIVTTGLTMSALFFLH